jgi:hypothetical protein
MKCLQNRPAAKVDAEMRIKRVHGGYLVRVSPQWDDEKHYEAHNLIAKSLHEVQIFVKEWAQGPADAEQEKNS